MQTNSVQELLLEIDLDEEQISEQKKDDDELQLDPHNTQHIEWMQQYIMNYQHQHLEIKMDDNSKMEPNTNPFEFDGDIEEINITHTQFPQMDEFNKYLSTLLLHISAQSKPSHPKLSDDNSYDEILESIPSTSSYKQTNSNIFRSDIMSDKEIQTTANLKIFRIAHRVNIESLKLIHDILQLSKCSLLSISFKLKLSEQAPHSATEDKVWTPPHLITSSVQTSFGSELSLLNVSSSNALSNNMMISCVSSILKILERCKHLHTFCFRLSDCQSDALYDYFTHFDLHSDHFIFPALQHLTIWIDDNLSHTEVSSFPFSYHPILAFLKKLKPLQSISVIVDDKMTQLQANNEQNEVNFHQYQFTVYWVKKLCEKIFDILNKSQPVLRQFYFKNIRSDCGMGELFMEMLTKLIKNHQKLN